MLGIPYRVYHLRRMRQRNSSHLAHLQLLVAESGEGPTIFLRSFGGWTVGSKLMAATAAFVLISGLILTVLTMDSSFHLDAYRPVIFTILGILCIVVGPMVVCRMVLKAYDRRLAREQRQFELFTRQLRIQRTDARGEAAGESSAPSGAQLAVQFLLGRNPVPERQTTCRNASDWFPETLPSYERAVQQQGNVHWMSKFFDYQKAPPPAYKECIEMELLQPRTEANSQNPVNSTAEREQPVQPPPEEVQEQAPLSEDGQLGNSPVSEASQQEPST